MNIYDYVKWRGDISFKQSPFNELDSLILTQMPYLDWSKIPADQTPTLAEAAPTLTKPKTLLFKERYLLALKIAQSERFKDIRIINYTRDFDPEKEKQFCAMTFKLPDHTYYVAYEGTDSTLVGWKENFNMTYMSPTPAQRDALKYLRKTISPLRFVRIGGHSKGGNLAFYAAIMVKKPYKIIEVHNFDGPGFTQDFIDQEEYELIRDKLKTFIPQSSVIGRLLNNKNQTVVVKSGAQRMLFQHDVISWEVDFNKLLYITETTRESRFMEQLFDDWYNQVSVDDKIVFINTVYETLLELGYTTSTQITSHPARVMAEMTKKAVSFKPEIRNILLNVIGVLLKCNVRSFYDNYVDSILNKRNEVKDENTDIQ